MDKPQFFLERWACERPRWRWPLLVVAAVVLYAWACQVEAAGLATAVMLPLPARASSSTWAPLDELGDLAALVGDEDLGRVDRLAFWLLALFVLCVSMLAVFL